MGIIGPTVMGPHKNKNEQISVGHFFCGKHAMGAKKQKCSIFFVGLCFFCDHFSVGGHEKTQTYGTVHAFRSTVQNLPLRTRCVQGGRNDSNSEDEMCPRWASFSN